jgi:hypothetical protein
MWNLSWQKCGTLSRTKVPWLHHLHDLRLVCLCVIPGKGAFAKAPHHFTRVDQQGISHLFHGERGTMVIEHGSSIARLGQPVGDVGVV